MSTTSCAIPTRPWLVIDAPGDADHGLFARDADKKPLIFESVTERVVPLGTQGARPALSGRVTLDDGRAAVPSFELLAEKYLDAQYAPEAVAEATGVSADVIPWACRRNRTHGL